MQWSCDRTGFPELELSDLRLAVHLWPVSKPQFERYLAEPNGPGDTWYEQLLAVWPRVSLASADPQAYEGLLVGGIQPAEAQKFAQWLGSGYNLPTVEAWRAIDRALSAQLFTEEHANGLRNDANLSRSAKRLLAMLLQQSPQTWGQLSLMRGGMLEWVVSGPKAFGGFGVPRTQFYSMIMNPQRDRPVQPLREGRHRFFGFRLIRAMK